MCSIQESASRAMRTSHHGPRPDARRRDSAEVARRTSKRSCERMIVGRNDSTGWHADKPPSRFPTSVVPVLSLGATRRFLIRPRDGGRSQVFVVAAGDLVVMGGRCQRDWVHAVPKETSPSGVRISVNFGSGAYAAATIPGA